MKPDPTFLDLPAHFWANVRLISQEIGYSQRKQSQIKAPSVDDIKMVFERTGLSSSRLIFEGKPTELGARLIDYFNHRANVLNQGVEPKLMDADKAKRLFHQLKRKLSPQCPLPMNKQKGKKRAPAYMTGIANMLIEANIGELPCDYDPRKLITITRDGLPIRTLARRIDGAFPSTVNPIAAWEIKEYYYTTTFGSRVADGIYETLLDGMELSELKKSQGIVVEHYLIVDDHFTWWDCGRSYPDFDTFLCSGAANLAVSLIHISRLGM